MNGLNKYKVELNKDITEFVSTIITNNDGKPLVLKRSEKLKLDPGKYDMCSGHMKQGECPMQSIYRELKEEVGISQEDIIEIRSLGTIQNPHPKFPNTLCHIYHIVINLEESEINRRIENISEQEREIEYVRFLKNINELRVMQKYTKLMRTSYNSETEKIYRKLEEDCKNRKERECEEK